MMERPQKEGGFPLKKNSRLRRFLLIFLIAALLPLAVPAAQAEKQTGVVRVLLTRLNLTDRAEIALDGSYTLGELSFQRGSKVTFGLVGGSLYAYYEGMTLNAGKSAVLVRHETDDGKENGVRINGKYELHPGDLHLSIQDGRIQTVLYAPVEEYLLGVVPYEMSDSYPLEALKAQAVAARTYALRKAGSAGAYDLVDNTNDQAYYGVKKEHTNAARAVKETAGVCGYWKKNLAECYYSASNGGQTELPKHVWGDGDYGYFAVTDDPYDLENPESVVKKYSLPKSFSGGDALGGLREPVLSALAEIMESRGYDGDMDHIRVTGVQGAETALPLYRDTPTQVMSLLRLSLSVEGRRMLSDDGEEEISIFSAPGAGTAASASKEQWGPMQALSQPVTVALDLFPTVESALGLSINAGSNEIITVRETDDAFIIESRRYGHGVGMSQRGAQWMAGKYGMTYEQILRFYYPGMTLDTVSYAYALPTPLAHQFLATPGPAATPTTRPTLMPLSLTPGPGEYRVKVGNIGVNSYLNLREAPNTSAGVLRQLYFGQPLIVVQELEDWLLVKTDDAEGYVMNQFTVKEK